ncbi:ATP-dependent DNA ligase [Tsukamurella sp. 8F]|uniref:ATP-dependent DNA ligase n=1 Tax=unclassified Tsukamurella TaxID=2633480 RepID=UPI0023B98F32|nr:MULTISPECIES: ATP-dependent DNA ligase [unclassified Tsukamurella]MDF0531501.1 ATP-dependent DNA ligase [Tsukamurella sp. 8J]MDF0588745.1 ATP-dependent DNA ligase [Tsukamurella sp. 8F]
MPGPTRENRDVDGVVVPLTNLDKVLYPETGTTKGEVIDYFEAIAPQALPHLRGRPLTRKRWPNGVDRGDFFEKRLPTHAPGWIRRGSQFHSDGESVYPVVDNVASMVWLGQQAALELHVPQWRFTPDGAPGDADRLVLDLDPGPGVELDDCARLALRIRDLLEGMGLPSVPVTSGSKGIHVYAPLREGVSSRGARTVARAIATQLEAETPELVTATMAKSERASRILVDWSQNHPGKTTIAPYSLRGRPRPYVAAPRSWDELETGGLTQLDFRAVLARASESDPLDVLLPSEGEVVRLDEYRAKRSAVRTPEPFGGESTGGAPIFVIQEHHARRLHYDFRLEHDGVLVSWAVPKNLPEDPGRNHLAVHTEDHPMDYAGFEGTIPRGEYGGGEVTIWDTGTYDLEKWRPDEVIVTLHGEKLAGRRYALIRTGEKNWLAHLMAAPSSMRQPESGPAPSLSDREVPAPLLSDREVPAPMLPTESAIGGLSGTDWAFEGKWDGYRVIATVTGGEVSLRSRSRRVSTSDFPGFAALAAALGTDVVLDGEAVVLDEAGVPAFHLMRTGYQARFYVFDVLSASGVDLTRRPWEVRREVLESLAPLLESSGIAEVPPLLDAPDGTAAVARSDEFGWEGVVAKRRSSEYLPGIRSRSWLKHKHWRDLQVVIGGWKPGRGSRESRIGSVLVGAPAPTGLVFLGAVGSGFSDRDLDALAGELEPLRMRMCPFVEPPSGPEFRDVVWVLPRVVGDVRYSSLRAGGHLRQPTWRGFRRDLLPGDVPDADELPWEGEE